MDAGFSLTNLGSTGVLGALGNLKERKREEGRLFTLRFQALRSRRECFNTITSRTVTYANTRFDFFNCGPSQRGTTYGLLRLSN